LHKKHLVHLQNLNKRFLVSSQHITQTLCNDDTDILHLTTNSNSNFNFNSKMYIL